MDMLICLGLVGALILVLVIVGKVLEMMSVRIIELIIISSNNKHQKINKQKYVLISKIDCNFLCDIKLLPVVGRSPWIKEAIIFDTYEEAENMMKRIEGFRISQL